MTEATNTEFVTITVDGRELQAPATGRLDVHHRDTEAQRDFVVNETRDS